MADPTTAARAKVMSRMRGNCDNCGEPMMAHCQRHLIPCCPHYQLHEAEAAAPYRKALERLDGAVRAALRTRRIDTVEVWEALAEARALLRREVEDG